MCCHGSPPLSACALAYRVAGSLSDVTAVYTSSAKHLSGMMKTGCCMQEDGEKTVVLKSEGPDLQVLEEEAQSLLLPTYLVEDAGKHPVCATSFSI